MSFPAASEAAGWRFRARGRRRFPAWGLPDSILEANACRYRLEDDVFRLTGQKKIRDGLDGVRGLFNDTVRGETIGRADSNWMACAMPSRGPAEVTALDVVWVAAATGGVVEIRVWRGPCTAVMAARVGARAAKDPLLRQLDEWLPADDPGTAPR